MEPLHEKWIKKPADARVLSFAMKKLCYLGCYLGCVVGLSLTLQSCGLFQPPVIKTVMIESYQTQCTMPSYPFSQTLCMVMTEPNGDTQLVTGIGGFDYEWGYRYELVIKETKPDSGLQDAPSVFRDLVRLESKEKVAPGTTFEMRLETVLPSGYVGEGMRRQIITQDAPSLFSFFKDIYSYDPAFGREFTCAAALCDEFGNLIEQELELTVEFAHPGGPDEPLIAKRIVSIKALPDWY